MDAEIIKRLKAWFYLRLAPEDWTEFGSSAPQVLHDFDRDPNREDALLRFAEVVVLLEIQKLKNPRLAFSVAKQRALELKRLGLTREQLKKVSGIDRLLAGGYLEIDCDGKPVLTEKGRKVWADGPPPPPQT
jgi:hypothetical protein